MMRLGAAATAASGFRRLGLEVRPGRPLTAQSQALDELLVSLRLRGLQVIEELATLVDELHEPTAGGVIALVRREMLTQTIDALGQQRDLYFGRARVRGSAAELRENSTFLLAA